MTDLLLLPRSLTLCCPFQKLCNPALNCSVFLKTSKCCVCVLKMVTVSIVVSHSLAIPWCLELRRCSWLVSKSEAPSQMATSNGPALIGWFKGSSCLYRCFHIFSMLRPLLRWKLGGAMLEWCEASKAAEPIRIDKGVLPVTYKVTGRKLICG